MEEESKKTYHDQEKKKMIMKIGKAGGCGGIGAVVLLGVATLAAAAIASAIIRRKEQKSGKNNHRHLEVEQSLPTELPETLNKENDRDDASKGPITPLSVQINTCNGAADMDVIKDDSDSFLFTENLKLNEKPMLEINGGTGSPAYKEEEIFCSDNTKKLESSANTDGSVTVVYKEEFHLPTFDDKLLLEPESKNEMQSREVEIEITKDDDAIEGVHLDKIMAENNQEMQENIEGKKSAVEMQFTEEDQTKNCHDQEIFISVCSSVAGNIVTENYGEGGQKFLLPVFDSRLIIEHENTNSDEKESSLPIESVEKTEGNKATETAQVDDSIHKSEMQLVKQECDNPDAEIVQDYEQEISRNDDEQNAEISRCEDHVKDVQTFSLLTELPETLNENDQDDASKDVQIILPHTPPLVKKIPRLGAAHMDFEADSASRVFAKNLELNEKPTADGSVTVIKEEFHLPTFDDKFLLEPASRNEMHKHKVETELAKEDGVHIDRIMAKDNQNMQENIEGKQNAVEMKFSEEKTKNCNDQEIFSTGSSMPGTILSENYSEDGKELLLPVFDGRPIIQRENLNSDDKEGSLPIESVQKSERNEAIEMAQVDKGIQNAKMQLGKQEECDDLNARILPDYEQNAENSQCEDCAKAVQSFSLPILCYPSNIMPGIAIEKDFMDELLSTEAIRVDVTNVAASANQEMKENSSLELAVCQQKESENTDKDIEEASETIRAGIDTSEYDLIMQMSEDEEKGEDNGDDSDDSDEEDFTNTTEESSVGTGNSSTETNAECAEESLPEFSIELQKPKLDNQIVEGKIQEDTSVEEHDSLINVENLNIIAASSETTGGELAKELIQLRLNDLKEEENTEENQEVKAEEPNFLKRVENLNIIPDGKGNSKTTYMVELAATHNDQPAYSSRRRILIGALSALSWFSCTWFFGLSFVKLSLIVFLTMILSKIHGY
ncbi:Uncharacterized protein Adt_01448 [Abeliophyllum distichum]|uniref:Uncharacterized protein n=1 Tax=Abeliophyllum distichum TaxID=126358 RepID=A0ABD1VW03_9LAMI